MKGRRKVDDEQKAAVEDAELAFGEPAVLCNWFVLSQQTIGFRLAFGERQSVQGKLAVRGAYFLSRADATALRDLIDRALASDCRPTIARH
mgnify:CR=1 FL=1